MQADQGAPDESHSSNVANRRDGHTIDTVFEVKKDLKIVVDKKATIVVVFKPVYR
jgi:hypothetical protein